MRKLLLLFPLLAAIGFAQQTVVTGAQVPDRAAQIAVLSIHSMYATAAQAANTEVLHAKIGFSVADHAIYDQVMQNLAAQRGTPGWARALRSTYATLFSQLSAAGQAQLNAFVQNEKQHMRYQVQAPIPQD